jgi:hypothetical protein
MTASIRHIKWLFGLIVVFAFAITLFSSVTAFAELLGPGGNDPNALASWQGVRHFSKGGLKVDIEFAVYEPGEFNLSFQGNDPSNGNLFVYAYQLLNLATSTDSIQKLSVGQDLNDPSLSNLGEFNDPTLPIGVASSSSYIGSPPASVVWTYTQNVNVLPGGKSKILLYTSPNGPELNLSNLKGLATSPGSVPDMLPSPVPEPITWLSLAIAGGFFLVIRALRGSFSRLS